MRRIVANALSLLALILTTAVPARAVTINPGDLVVTGQETSVGLYVAVVDRFTGVAQIVSSGNLITSPWTVAAAPDGFIYVGNSTNIIKVDPATGGQTLFSTNLALTVTNASNMICHSNGYLYYTASGHVYRVDRATGGQSNITAASNPFAVGICEGPDGQIYASCEVVTPNGVVSTRRVDPVTGTWVNTSFGTVAKPRGIGFDQRDSLYVESWSNRAVYRVDLAAGTVGQLSGTTNEYTAMWMVAHPDGFLYFVHLLGAGPRIDRQETVTGVRTSLPTSAVLGQGAAAINVVPFGATPTQTTTWGRVKSLYR